MLVAGVLFDVVSLTLALYPALLAMSMLRLGFLRLAAVRIPLLVVVLGSICFNAVAEYCFFEEFNARYNHIALDYLIYPREVFVSIWDSYNVPLPGDSVVKRDYSTNVASVARVFKAMGARTAYFYGGFGLFDSTKPPHRATRRSGAEASARCQPKRRRPERTRGARYFSSPCRQRCTGASVGHFDAYSAAFACARPVSPSCSRYSTSSSSRPRSSGARAVAASSAAIASPSRPTDCSATAWT